MTSPSASASPPKSARDAAVQADRPDATILDWFSLLKPRVVSLVVFTAAVGLITARGTLDPVRVGIALVCVALGAGAAGAMNMWYDHDIDVLMRRTCRRPVPAGRIAPSHALLFGLTLATVSVLVMALATNAAAASLLACSIAFYVVVYTVWLKRRTPYNIVWGGAAGAFPPAIGWLAVSGTLDLLPVLMFAIVFLWTPPHFWSLSIVSHTDYRRANVPMLPVVAGLRETRRQIFAYSSVLVVVSLLPWALCLAGTIYGASAMALGMGLMSSAWSVLRDQRDASGASRTSDAPARAMFKYSILYLFALFSALAVDRLVG